MMVASGKRSASPRTTSGRSGSPQKKKCVSSGIMAWPKSGSARQMEAKVGVETQQVASEAASASKSSRASSVTSAVRATMRPPVVSAPTSSVTERSKESSAWLRKTCGSAASAKSDWSHGMKLATSAAVTSTPLGVPVEPEVKMMYCVSSPETSQAGSGRRTTPRRAASRQAVSSPPPMASTSRPSAKRSGSSPTASAGAAGSWERMLVTRPAGTCTSHGT